MSTDRMKIQPEVLATSAARSADTEAARAPVAIASPPPVAAGSPVDAAAVALGTTIQGALAATDTADVAAVTKQTAALTESPPELVQQDIDNAANITAAGQFPTPTVRAPGASGTVWTV
ncbi:MAG TPA: hypothetical protein P5314_11920 [Tetrasphaera sp.]|nr:hypothetical protein [Tetrasphaera sp.]